MSSQGLVLVVVSSQLKRKTNTHPLRRPYKKIYFTNVAMWGHCLYSTYVLPFPVQAAWGVYSTLFCVRFLLNLAPACIKEG